jgi:hypothetical protein
MVVDKVRVESQTATARPAASRRRAARAHGDAGANERDASARRVVRTVRDGPTTARESEDRATRRVRKANRTTSFARASSTRDDDDGDASTGDDGAVDGDAGFGEEEFFASNARARVRGARAGERAGTADGASRHRRATTRNPVDGEGVT